MNIFDQTLNSELLNILIHKELNNQLKSISLKEGRFDPLTLINLCLANSNLLSEAAYDKSKFEAYFKKYQSLYNNEPDVTQKSRTQAIFNARIKQYYDQLSPEDKQSMSNDFNALKSSTSQQYKSSKLAELKQIVSQAFKSQLKEAFESIKSGAPTKNHITVADALLQYLNNSIDKWNPQIQQ